MCAMLSEAIGSDEAQMSAYGKGEESDDGSQEKCYWQSDLSQKSPFHLPSVISENAVDSTPQGQW